jgi:hypothetical protein
MGHRLPVVMLLLFAAAPCVFAEAVRPGDQVRFIERDQHIPARPAPGDTRVHRRFGSGSAATVLQVNAATGWIDAAAQGPTPFTVLGEFNRRLTHPGDPVWNQLLDHCPVLVEL